MLLAQQDPALSDTRNAFTGRMAPALQLSPALP